MNLRATLPTGKAALGAMRALRADAGLHISLADAVLSLHRRKEKKHLLPSKCMTFLFPWVERKGSSSPPLSVREALTIGVMGKKLSQGRPCSPQGPVPLPFPALEQCAGVPWPAPPRLPLYSVAPSSAAFCPWKGRGVRAGSQQLLRSRVAPSGVSPCRRWRRHLCRRGCRQDQSPAFSLCSRQHSAFSRRLSSDVCFRVFPCRLGARSAGLGTPPPGGLPGMVAVSPPPGRWPRPRALGIVPAA